MWCETKINYQQCVSEHLLNEVAVGVRHRLEHITLIGLHFGGLVSDRIIPTDLVLGDAWLLAENVAANLLNDDLRGIRLNQLRIDVVVVHVVSALNGDDGD